jgi:hypothetical protein
LLCVSDKYQCEDLISSFFNLTSSVLYLSSDIAFHNFVAYPPIASLSLSDNAQKVAHCHFNLISESNDNTLNILSFSEYQSATLESQEANHPNTHLSRAFFLAAKDGIVQSSI